MGNTKHDQKTSIGGVYVRAIYDEPKILNVGLITKTMGRDTEKCPLLTCGFKYQAYNDYGSAGFQIGFERITLTTQAPELKTR